MVTALGAVFKVAPEIGSVETKVFANAPAGKRRVIPRIAISVLRRFTFSTCLLPKFGLQFASIVSSL